MKIPAAESEAVYHCISRTVNGEWLWDEAAKEVLRQQLWQVSEFCGIEVLTYVIMANHFHVLVRVPQLLPVSDAELLRRYKVLYPQPTTYQAMKLEVIASELGRNSPEAAAWRNRQLTLMGDVSQFMKLLKQRFSIWFNHSHGRFGTLWAERFKSVLLEARSETVRTIAAYIDLNCVRAGIVADPKDYRYCGYAEAIAGRTRAQTGIITAVCGQEWAQAQAAYREMLFGIGGREREGKAAIPATEVQRVLADGGQLPLPTLLRCRIRYFTAGAILGTTAFVRQHMAKLPVRAIQSEHALPRRLPSWTNWSDLAAPHRIRPPLIG
jgi:REP element-mobilizing transposase RayT